MPIRLNSAHEAFNYLENYLLQEFSDRLKIIQFIPEKILLLGHQYSPLLIQKIQAQYPNSQITQLSPKPNFRKNITTKNNWIKKLFSKKKSEITPILSTFETLPFSKNSFDMVISNLEIFNSDLKQSIPEISRILKKEGLLMLSLPGPDCFLELRTAMASWDTHPHLDIYPDMHDLGDQLIKAPFKDPVMDVERIKINLPSLHTVFKLIQIIRPYPLQFTKFLYTPRSFKHWEKNYPKNLDGSYPVQFEINFAHAWGLDPLQTKNLETGETRVSLDILKMKK